MASLTGKLRRRIRKLERRKDTPPDRPRNLPLLDWTRRYLPSILTCAVSEFHVWLAEQLDAITTSRDARLAVQAPRGSAKSSWASLAYPLREILEGREPFVVIVSDSSGQAETFLRQIRAHIEDNELIARDYPESCGRGTLWRDSHIRLRNGCEVLALGTGGKIRGRKSTSNRRATLVIADDLQNKDHILSALQRNRTWEWFSKDLMSAGEPGTNFVVLGTALHREAVVCQLEGLPVWRSRKWQAIMAWPERMDLWREYETYLYDYGKDDDERERTALKFYLDRKGQMDAGARLLWPDRQSLLELLIKRASDGHAAFESEYQNSPVNPESCEWPEEYLNWPGMWFNDWPALETLSIRTASLDPSKGKSDKQGDYSAIILYGRDRNGVEYVEADIKRRPVDVMCADTVEQYKWFCPEGLALEVNGFQELLSSPLEQAARAAGVANLRTYTYDNTVPKQVRIRRLTQPLAQRRFRFKARSPGTMLLVQQMRDWPAGSHEDGPDALEMSRRLAIELSSKKASARPK